MNAEELVVSNLNGNKLIAKFMGLESFEHARYGFMFKNPHEDVEPGHVFGYKGLKYDKSWNWQIAAWVKAGHVSRDYAATKEPDANRHHQDMDRYEQAVSNGNLQAGFDVIVSIIKLVTAEENTPVQPGQEHTQPEPPYTPVQGTDVTPGSKPELPGIEEPA